MCIGDEIAPFCSAVSALAFWVHQKHFYNFYPFFVAQFQAIVSYLIQNSQTHLNSPDQAPIPDA